MDQPEQYQFDDKQVAVMDLCSIVPPVADKFSSGLVLVDPCGTITYGNERAGAMLGYAREELVGMPIDRIDAQFTPENWEACWDGLKEIGFEENERKLLTRSHEPLSCVCSSYYLKNRSECFCAIFIQETLGRNSLVANIEINRFHLLRFLNSLAWPVVIFSKDPSLIILNHEARSLYDLPRPETEEVSTTCRLDGQEPASKPAAPFKDPGGSPTALNPLRFLARHFPGHDFAFYYFTDPLNSQKFNISVSCGGEPPISTASGEARLLYQDSYPPAHQTVKPGLDGSGAISDQTNPSNGLLNKISGQLESLLSSIDGRLEQRTEKPPEQSEQTAATLRRAVTPYLEKLKRTGLRSNQLEFLNLIEENLDRLTSPFLSSLSSEMYKLSPAQVRIAQMIKDGKSNKEMASLLHLSKSTILTHRHHIRHKLGIKNKKVNLRSFLSSL